jgi:hypothetical protein
MGRCYSHQNLADWIKGEKRKTRNEVKTSLVAQVEVEIRTGRASSHSSPTPSLKSKLKRPK